MVSHKKQKFGRKHLIIREFERRDLEDCIEMGRASHKESQYHLPYDPHRVKTLYLNSINNPNYKVFLAFEADELIGGIAVVIGQYNYNWQHFVQDIVTYVYPGHRGTSAGIKLYKKVYEWAKKIGASEVRLDYQFLDNNPKIEKFYARLGYKPYGRTFRKLVIDE
jgi:GNAT superfamily N-acetyltransferase